MLPLGDEPTEEQLHAYYRTYILGLIGGVLMPDKLVNNVHLMYSPFLTSQRGTRQYNMGFAYLVVLSRELHRTINAK